MLGEKGMKNLLIICGTGIATSTVVTGKVQKWLKEKGYDKDVKLHQGKVSDGLKSIDRYDVVISTTMVPDRYKERVINAVPLLTGVGTEDVFAEIEKELSN